MPMKGWTRIHVDPATVVDAVQKYFDDELFRFKQSPKVVSVEPPSMPGGSYGIVCKESYAVEDLQSPDGMTG